MIKILLVDDSTFIRKTVRQMLSYAPDIQIIDEAGDGREAINKALELNPDVIIMDIIMPGVDGIWALEEVMKQKPTPVIIFSSIGIASSDVVQLAFSLGVVDVVTKPDNPASIPLIARELIEKIRAASKIDKLRLLELKSVSAQKTKLPARLKTHQVVVIVTSAGGPPSLYEVVAKFSQNMLAGIVIAQHMPSNFVPSFVEHIQKLTPLTAKIATKGDILHAREILFSPTDATLELHRTKKGPVVDIVNYKTRLQPNIDQVIISCAQVFKSSTILVVLSGLGNDGVKGAEEVKKAGGKVIVEDKATAGLYSGMPLSVVTSGFYDITCPSYSIAETVENYLNNKAVRLDQSKFIVKGSVLRSVLNYLKTKTPLEEYSKIIASLSEDSKTTVNGFVNSYNYYPGSLYNELCERIAAFYATKNPSLIETISAETARDCFQIYRQGFPHSNFGQFISFLPSFQKMIFPETEWESVEVNPETRLVVFLQRSTSYTKDNTTILARASKGWLSQLFEAAGFLIQTLENVVGEDPKGWHIKTTIRCK